MLTDTFLMICCMAYRQITSPLTTFYKQIPCCHGFDFRNRSQMTSKCGNTLFLPRFNIGQRGELNRIYICSKHKLVIPSILHSIFLSHDLPLVVIFVINKSNPTTHPACNMHDYNTSSLLQKSWFGKYIHDYVPNAVIIFNDHRFMKILTKSINMSSLKVNLVFQQQESNMGRQHRPQNNP